jgi:trehalose 6-phosphate synthase
VAPADIEGVVRALHQALSMPRRERAARARSLRQIVHERDLTAWLESQFQDLVALA